MIALPAKPFLAPKMAELDVTLTSFVANLSQALEQFLDSTCNRNVQEGTESLAMIGAVVLEILRKDWRVQKVAPHPARVRDNLFICKIETYLCPLTGVSGQNWSTYTCN